MENKKTNAVRIIIFCVFIAAIIVVMSLIVGGTSTSTKFDEFAQCLTAKKLKFYGAFWCPHCQAEKASFGDAAQFLPYVECSNADRSQKQECNDMKVESYPTWVYPTPISITSNVTPVECQVQPGPANQNPLCAVTQYGSSNFKSWLFPQPNSKNSILKISSATDPAIVGSTYTFPAGSRTVGELDDQAGFQTLATFSGCALPAGSTATTTAAQ